MPYSTLADLVLLLHFLFILFVLFGGLLVLYRRWTAWLHVPMFLWGALVNLTPWRCPLTPLENHFRQLAGQTGYEGGFVEHYIAPLVYPQGLTADLGMVVGTATLLWNTAVYGFVFYRGRH
ncbi:MAG: DUF2784 domain-containing protein [Gammaproteobacteria bacterium]|nr:DUF2784 domain-containing protein [Gammaproteobacteria bacterium]MCW8927514.1 DUF2784 domain-containing protein [Gammaproteobacteria bacterium]MCW8959615.1 DUF2784 domain-containing protein [Gammaproteobacteria bacterium]MCW8973903.1 DUF2784 domain-containing protein [Gammaproteobacteria bacterium]MCW8992904.1 DUF2784 domain-containing protein [Gammaproteobacteria bacterium]